MISDVWEVEQGAALQLAITLRDADGTVIDSSYPGGGYAGTEALSGQVWPGGTRPATFALAPTWLAAAAGTIGLTVAATQTAMLVPGRHRLRVLVGTGDSAAKAYEATLVVEGAPGGAN